MNESNSSPLSSRHSDPDMELEELLGDAFEAPAVPRSLLKRIDRAVEQEWGTSPRLADTAASQLGRSLGRGAKWLRALPIAAALSILVGLAVIFMPPGPGSYGWADLVRALREQSMVLVESPDQSRWMAASEGMVATEDDESLGLLNLDSGIQLDRISGAMQIGRRRVQLSGDRREKMVLALLLERTVNAPSFEFIQNARIVSETSESVALDGVDHVQLSVDVASDGFDLVSLRLLIDSETGLPSSCNVTGWAQTTQNLAFTYPETDAAELVATNFPTSLPLVDYQPVDIATASVNVDSPAVEKTAMKDASLDIDASEPAVADLRPNGHPAGVGMLIEEPKFVWPIDEDVAPSEWKPVVVTDLTGSQVIAEVNRVLEQSWGRNGVEPVARATDEELLRRVYLDLAGRTPGVSEVRSYLNDKSPDRYQVLVDRLLGGADHATHLATTFRTFLIPESVDVTAFGGVEAFDKWLAKEFERGESYDSIVKSLVLAEGRLSRSGPLLFYSANKLDADQLAARTARVFLGTRLECAQCHDHPFESWTQEDFWGFAAFFARISRPRGELEAVSTVMQVRDVDHGEVTMPESEEVIPPKFLNAAEALSDDDPIARRRLLADWMTSRDNPYFARATANRIWGQAFGKGIVEPLDDFGTMHPARSAELLDVLASHLINTNFSLRELFRAVVLTDAYQLSSGASTVDEERLAWFAQMNVKTLTAEQVYDCITVATLVSPPAMSGMMQLNVTRFGNSSREAFLQQFRTPAGRQTEYMGGIPQALTLMNGVLIDGATGLSSSGLLKSLEAPFFTNAQRVEVLYFATLSRRPTVAESSMLNGYISEDATGEELREGLSDILWSLLNSAEFTMNH